MEDINNSILSFLNNTKIKEELVEPEEAYYASVDETAIKSEPKIEEEINESISDEHKLPRNTVVAANLDDDAAVDEIVIKHEPKIEESYFEEHNANLDSCNVDTPLTIKTEEKKCMPDTKSIKIPNVTKLTRRTSCQYLNCHTNRGHKLKLFRFPYRHKEICERWIANSGNESLVGTPSEILKIRYLCAKHFTDKDYRSGKKHFLKVDAVPKLYLDDKEYGGNILKVKAPTKTYLGRKKCLLT